ncbi:MAG: HAD-IA family hydrolase [Clostridia bacterium]|nr:HAD-IA family hydrolase [Clostridia bacterium]
MKDYDYILFDLDGTLTDSKPGIVNCIRYAFDKHGIEYTDAILDKMVGPPFRVSMKEFFGLELDQIEELIKAYRGAYENDGWRDISVYDGVFDMLGKLKTAGKRLAVATSKPIKFTRIIIDEMGFKKYFDFIGGASQDASKESKADVINLALDNLGVKDRSKVLMVGDRSYDIVGAKECGVDVAAVLWGYGNREEFETCGADYIVDAPSDVVKLVLGR